MLTAAFIALVMFVTAAAGVGAPFWSKAMLRLAMIAASVRGATAAMNANATATAKWLNVRLDMALRSCFLECHALVRVSMLNLHCGHMPTQTRAWHPAAKDAASGQYAPPDEIERCRLRH
jgi:hypothetical protein